MQPAVERSKFLKGQKNCQFLLQLFLNALFFSFSAHGAFGLTYISNTPRVFQGRKKKFNFATGIVGSHISSWIQVIFVSVFLYFSFSSFEFWDASWYSSTTIWNCKNIRAWKINPTIIWKKYSINKNKSGVENLKTYWLYEVKIITTKRKSKNWVP